MSAPRTGVRTFWVALRAMLVFTIVMGIAYPLAVTGIGQFALPWQANGSVVIASGKPVGSALIGQSFSGADGEPLAQYFQPRPSATGQGYDATTSGGSNLGPSNPALVAEIAARKAQIAILDGVNPRDIPADALTASASGLDPHISPAYALLQVPRVATQRGLDESTVRRLVESKIQERDLGYLGEATVNVLLLNIALDELKD